MAIYCYDQNLVRGEARGPALRVLVEAVDAEHAEKLAESAGLYFDGVAKGIDCPCCGDRWRRTERPMFASRAEIQPWAPIEDQLARFYRLPPYALLLFGNAKPILVATHEALRRALALL